MKKVFYTASFSWLVNRAKIWIHFKLGHCAAALDGILEGVDVSVRIRVCLFLRRSMLVDRLSEARFFLVPGYERTIWSKLWYGLLASSVIEWNSSSRHMLVVSW